MEDSEIVISGPELTGPEYYGSVAEYLIPRMKAQPKDFVIQVDLRTNESLTSYEFLEQSLEIAEGLIQFGLRANDLVVQIGPNSNRTLVAAMGVFLSGGILAPLDWSLKPVELQHMFKEYKPKFILCLTEKANEIQTAVKALGMDVKIILVDATAPIGEFYCWEDIKTKVDVINYVPRAVEDSKKCICLVNCSSGTTGLPKGVALSHYAVLANFSAVESMNRTEVEQNFLLTSPLFWISGTMLLLNSSYFGQARYLPKSMAPEDVLEGIQICKPFFLLLSPTSILELVRVENFAKYNVGSVKNILSAGAPLGQSVINEVKEIWPGVILSNFYGLTETTGGVSVGFGMDKPGSVGSLVSGVKAKIVDVTTGKSLGPGETGEIRVKSSRMMNGYYNNEAATKKAFDENGWLCTGDWLYYDEQNTFYFVSRMQEIILYTSYKIAPAEIEAFIIGLPGVKDVAVVGVPHEADTNHLRALVVKDPKHDITADEIIHKVKENFTERKHLKQGVQFVDALPRTTVGKIRRVEVQKMIK